MLRDKIINMLIILCGIRYISPKRRPFILYIYIILLTQKPVTKPFKYTINPLNTRPMVLIPRMKMDIIYNRFIVKVFFIFPVKFPEIIPLSSVFTIVLSPVLRHIKKREPLIIPIMKKLIMNVLMLLLGNSILVILPFIFHHLVKYMYSVLKLCGFFDTIIVR